MILTVVGCVPPSEKPRRLLSNPVPKVRQLTILSREITHHHRQPSRSTLAVRKLTLKERADLGRTRRPGVRGYQLHSVGCVEGPTKLEHFLFSSYLVRDPLARLLRIRKWPLRVDTTGVVLLTDGSLLVARLAVGFSVDKSGCWCFVLGDTIVRLSAVPWFLSCIPSVARTASSGIDSVPWRADSYRKPWPRLAA